MPFSTKSRDHCQSWCEEVFQHALVYLECMEYLYINACIYNTYIYSKCLFDLIVENHLQAFSPFLPPKLLSVAPSPMAFLGVFSISESTKIPRCWSNFRFQVRLNFCKTKILHLKIDVWSAISYSTSTSNHWCLGYFGCHPNQTECQIKPEKCVPSGSSQLPNIRIYDISAGCSMYVWIGSCFTHLAIGDIDVMWCEMAIIPSKNLHHPPVTVIVVGQELMILINGYLLPALQNTCMAIL